MSEIDIVDKFRFLKSKVVEIILKVLSGKKLKIEMFVIIVKEDFF